MRLFRTIPIAAVLSFVLFSLNASGAQKGWIGINSVFLVNNSHRHTATPTPTPTPTPSPTPTGGLDVCANGAACDGVTNDYSAWAAILASHSAVLPAGKTSLINPPINGGIPVSGKTIQCGAGSLIKTTFQDTSDTSIFRFAGGTTSNVNHCTIQGANNITTPGFINAQQHNFLIENWCTPVQGACTLTLDSNTFQGCQGNACVSVFGNTTTGPVNGTVITNNTFKGCAIYGVALVSATNSNVSGNSYTDCATGSEADVIGQQNSNNVFNNETGICVNDIGWKPTASPPGKHMFFTGGEGPANFDYSTNVFENSSMTGSCARYDEGGTTTTHVATYTNNSCNGNNPPLSSCVTHF